jgi:chemotaxis protein MotB
MVSDLGAAQVTVGQLPVVDQVEEDDSDVIAQPRPHRDDKRSTEPDRAGQRAQPKPGANTARIAPPLKPATASAATSAQAAAAAASLQQDRQRPPTEGELRAELERREKQAFEEAAQQIREAVGSDPALAELARQLVIDMTPEGLRIQVLDEDRVPMFPFGSAVPNDRARLLLQKVSPVLARLTQDVSIAGHTDAVPFPGPGRTNWELSAERANATRRLLVDAGLQTTRIRSVTGNADRDPLVPADPLAAANRRISIVVLRSVRPALGEAPPPGAASQPAAATTPSPVTVETGRAEPVPAALPEAH